MYEMHAIGGMIYMVPLTIILLINVGLIIFVVLSIIRGTKVNATALESIRQLGGLALAWGTFSTVVGLYYAFKSLEEIKETLPFATIMGGLKVALITAIYGMIIFIISLVIFLALRAVTSRTSTN